MNIRIPALLRAYWENSKKIRRSCQNPFKELNNIDLKDKLEREFYDREAQRYLNDFREDVFGYDPDEAMPMSHRYFYSQISDIEDMNVLDICCGHGFTSVRLAKAGAIVSSIDISPKMIELTRRNAAYNGVENRIHAEVMSAQSLEFKAHTFDVVVGVGALHHLNLDLAGEEIARVLKTGGKALFIEPRMPYKCFVYIRSLFPNKCLESPGGSYLTDHDILELSKNFSDYKIKYFLFLRKLARFPLVNKLSVQLDRADAAIIERLPALARFYWAFVFQLSK